jgi:hypothetical protein
MAVGCLLSSFFWFFPCWVLITYSTVVRGTMVRRRLLNPQTCFESGLSFAIALGKHFRCKRGLHFLVQGRDTSVLPPVVSGSGYLMSPCGSTNLTEKTFLIELLMLVMFKQETTPKSFPLFINMDCGTCTFWIRLTAPMANGLF